MFCNHTMGKRAVTLWITGLVIICNVTFLKKGMCSAFSGFAADSTSTKASIPLGTGFPGGFEMLLRTAGSLLLVALLVIGVVFVLRRYVFNRNGFGNTEGAIKILNSTFLGPKKSIHLVKVLNRVLVLGISESGIQTLSEFNADEVESLLVKKIQEPKEQTFSKLLHSVIGHTKG